MNGFRLAYERQPAHFVTSKYGYRSTEAAHRALPIINSVRTARTFYPYTHLAEVVDGRVVKLVELPRVSS
jgi:hypothetical protein